MGIKRIEGKLTFETTGVLNYNNKGKITWDRQSMLFEKNKKGQDYVVVNHEEEDDKKTGGKKTGLKTKNGNNHLQAKLMLVGFDGDGNAKYRDYTSSNCINHYLFKDLIYRKAAGERNDWSRICSGPIGLMRGEAYLDKGKSFARRKTVVIGDAISENMQLGIEINSTSASKKEDDGDKNKNTFFSRENAPSRKQVSDIDIDIQSMSTFLIDGSDTQLMHTHIDEVDETLRLMREFFKSKDKNVDVSNINDKSQVVLHDGTGFRARGFVLSPEQICILLKDLNERLVNFHAVNSHGKVKFKEMSLEDQNGDPVSLKEINPSDIELMFKQVDQDIVTKDMEKRKKVSKVATKKSAVAKSDKKAA